MLWSATDPPQLEAKLLRESVISGRVVEPGTKRPVPDATVVIGSQPRDPWPLELVSRGERDAVRTDERGCFRIEGLLAGSYELTSRKAGATKTEPVEIKVGRCETRGDVELVLRTSGDLRGRFVAERLPADAHALLRVKSGEALTVVPDWMCSDRVPVVDGAFRFARVPPGDYELALLVPHHRGRCGWLEIPVESFPVPDDGLQREFDVSTALPGDIRGHVALRGDAPPHEQLLVRARPKPTEDRLWGNRKPWTTEPVAADGSFALPAAAGPCCVEVIAAATGVVLARTEVLVECGKVVSTRLEQDVVRVQIVLRPEVKGDPAAASRLAVVVDRPGTDASTLWAELERWNAGVTLSGGQSDVELWLPVLPIKLRVWSRANAVLQGEPMQQPSSLVDHDFTPTKDAGQRIVLKVPAPHAPDGK